MAMALLNFGQEAQKYFKDFNSDAPSNPNGYLAADMSSFKVDTANNNVESTNARKYGFSGSALDLAADTTLRVKFNGNYAVKLDGKTASTILDSGKYVLDITGLRCIDLDQKFKVTFTGDGGSGTLTLSALGWCNAIIDKFGLDDTNQSSRLARAVCLYSQAAENYFK